MFAIFYQKVVYFLLKKVGIVRWFTSGQNLSIFCKLLKEQ
ncbi:hypothetical protein F480_04155 [Bibersteinia trehalosi Y31]|uniref:Uncharacterized protein n=1 Tax=Bibersteinia trehalosi Y31 TaxID=1261658 RepID=A0A179D1Q7_BIBTR|nr:hypothetical protein F480_04155 [Bibersteinia trehalosi Y31]